MVKPNSLEQFELAYDAMMEAWRKTITIYCICGRLFPNGNLTRVLYGNVHYADNRCNHCKS